MTQNEEVLSVVEMRDGVLECVSVFTIEHKEKAWNLFSQRAKEADPLLKEKEVEAYFDDGHFESNFTDVYVYSSITNVASSDVA